MATMQQLESALINADKAGDTDAARRLSAILVTARKDQSNQIPGAQVPGTWNAPAEPTLSEKAIGTGEAALTALTGATGGAIGMIGGGAKQIVEDVAGLVSTKGYKPKQTVEQAAMQGASALTYEPRTQSGKEQAAAFGKAMQETVPAIPLTAELGVIGKSTSMAGRAATDVTASGVARIRAAAPAIADRVQRTLNRTPESSNGTRGSVGAAATDVAAQRIAMAESLPADIKLTKGMATRDPDQLRFEAETAKGEQGGPLRERFSHNNEEFAKAFDNLVDQTGATAFDGVAVGRSVEKALVKEAARDKAEIRVAYKNADKAGEMAEPVTLANLVDHLNESAPDAATAPLLSTARSRAISLGIAAEDGSGQLVPLQTSLKNAERMRQVIGNATDYTPTNIRQSTIIKGLIDAETESVGGALYRQARRTRENYAKKYENRASVESLLNRKKGSSDRQVALEDTFKHVILDGSREDLSYVRAALTAKKSQDGMQAWKDLQGATVNWLKDEALKNSATDQRGNRIMSAAQLDKAIRKLEQGNKMEFVFGKQGAQIMRDINELTKVAMTSPPGVVNTSNTASVLMAALAEAGVTGSMTGLPVPVVSGLRLIAKGVKDRKLRARIEQSLNGQPR